MKRLGVSVYVDQSPVEDIIRYLTKAAAHGFKRVFTCLISASGDPKLFLDDFRKVTAHVANLGLEVIADVDPGVFKTYELSTQDLTFFKTLNLSGIRLDMGFSGHEEALMSFNELGLIIELNISAGNRYVENIMSYNPKREAIYGCHNFYPHRYTGISRAHFLKCSEQFKNLNIKTAAFISSQVAEFGPWPVSEGLCTLEEHRNLSVTTQAKDLFNTGLIDDVILANMFASDAELEALGNLNKDLLTLTVDFMEKATALEKKIVLEEPHFNRGDVSEYMIRSTMSRVKYKGESFIPHDNDSIHFGDILIESDLYTRYAGEMQVALKSMENSGKTNIVARVCEEERFLIQHIKPWQSFRFSAK